LKTIKYYQEKLMGNAKPLPYAYLYNNRQEKATIHCVLPASMRDK